MMAIQWLACRGWLRLAGAGVLYALLVALVFGHLTTPGHVSMVWLPSGLGLAVVLSHGKKAWPVVFGGAFAGYALMLERPLWISAGIALGSNALEPLVTACLLSLGTGRHFDPALRRPQDYLSLALASATGAGLAASVGCGLLAGGGLLPRAAVADALLHWWMGNFLGLILVTPLLLVWRSVPRGWLQKDRLAETLACFGLAFLSGQAVFLGWLQGVAGAIALGYWMFLFVAWCAVRFGRHGVLLLIAMTAIQALMGAIRGVGFFAGDIAHTGLVNFWFYILALATVGITLALVIKQRSQVEADLRASEARLRQMSDFLPQQIWTAQPDGQLDYVNQRVADFFGRPVEAIIGSGWHELVHPDDLPACIRRWTESLQTGLPYEIDFRLLDHSGEYRWCIARAVALRDEGGAIVKWYGTNTDITERKQAEEALQLASLVYQTSSEAMMVTDADSVILAINPAFSQLTGYTAAEVIGKTPKILNSGRQGRSFYHAMWQTLAATGRWQGEIWDRRKDGGACALWLTINSSFNEDGSVHRRIALFSDITEKKKSEEMIWRQANFDSLTGLPNRQMFHDRLAQEIERARHADVWLALMFLDLDRFKEVNDTLGHDMGDILLKEAASRLGRCVREADTVARLGGDEFTIILGELHDVTGVERVAQEILASLAEPFRLGDELAYVSASIGITLYPADASDVDALVKNADQAMYAAKSQGRNRYSYFIPQMQEAAQARMRLAHDLREALAGNQFLAYYQPIVDLADGSVRKAEALIRWRHPTRGLIAPVEFIEVAEDSGLIIDIGDWVFREAARQAARWRHAHDAEFQVSVNKSAVQFLSESSRHTPWLDYLQELGLPGQGIMLDISECLLPDASAIVAGQLLKFRKAGLQVAIDDFGTGHSSLAYLRKHSIDYLKIAPSFVHNLAPASDDLALCEAMIVMAHKLGIKVIAEGVETAEQCDLLTTAGCDYAQGHWFSRPLPAEAFGRLLEGSGSLPPH